MKFNDYPFQAAKVDKHEAVEDAGAVERDHDRVMLGFEANGRRYFLDEDKIMRWEPIKMKPRSEGASRISAKEMGVTEVGIDGVVIHKTRAVGPSSSQCRTPKVEL